jgi:hypothetical protein
LTEHDHILVKLDQQAELIEKQADRLVNIEKLVTSIAVQEERLENMQNQLGALWRKYDAAFGPGGILSHIQSYQAACPKNDLRNQIKLQWTAIGLIVVLIGTIKLWG